MCVCVEEYNAFLADKYRIDSSLGGTDLSAHGNRGSVEGVAQDTISVSEVSQGRLRLRDTRACGV